MTRQFEFLIVGGGVYGCALAWELARHGAAVGLLEASTLASGASGGPGMRGVRANRRHRQELPLARLANEIWPVLGTELDADIGYQQIGGLELFESAATVERAQAQVDLQEHHGVRTRLIDRDELHAIEPCLSERVIGASFCPNDGVVDHTATTLAFAHAAVRNGAVVFEHTPVVSVERSARRVIALTSQNERFEASRDIVLLVNAGIVDLLGELELTLPIGAVFPQVVLTQAASHVKVRHLVGHLERRLAMKQIPGASLAISGGWLGRWNAETQRGETVAESVEANLAEACRVLPALEGVKLVEAHADRPEAVGPELLPIIDRPPSLENVLVGTAWSGHGFAIAPAVCRLLASWLLGADKPPELTPFRWPA